MFKNYLYLSSTSNSFKQHFKNSAKNYIKQFKLDKSAYIIDIGSNDGIGLIPFKDLGYKNLLGVEPATNLSKLANKKRLKHLMDF